MMLKEYKIIMGNNMEHTLSLVRTYDIKYESLNSSDEIIGMLNECFNHGNCVYEYLYIIGYDERQNVTGIMEVSQGNQNSCSYGFDKIMTFLLLTGSKYYSLIHNHPNGVLKASEDDMNMFVHCLLTGKCFDKILLNNLIVYKNEFIEVELEEDYCEKNGIYNIKNIDRDILPNKISQKINENGLTSTEYYILDNFISEMYRVRTSSIIDGGIIN